MNPRLVEPGFVARCYTPTAPLVPVRTSTATSRRSDRGDMRGLNDTGPRRSAQPAW
jgi:hypothetical protein